MSFEFITWKTDKIWTRQELLSLEVRDSEENNNESNQQIQEETLEVGAIMTLDEAIKHCLEKSDCTDCGKEHLQLANWLKELLEFRFLAEQSLLFRLPCKVGDKLYVIPRLSPDMKDCAPYVSFPIVEYTVDSFILTNTTIIRAHRENTLVEPVDVCISIDEFGKTVFRTMEDAQEARLSYSD